MEIEFYSNRFSLYHLEHYFCYLAEGLRLSSNLRDKVRLCFYEAVTNAVVHGNQFDETKKVWIRSFVEGNKVMLAIRDEGDGFDLSQVPNPIDSANLEKTSGRGVFFVKESCEKCDYSKERNEFIMEWNLE